MSHNEQNKLTPLQWILKYWVILFFIVGSITVWTTVRNTVDGHTEQIKLLQEEVAKDRTNVGVFQSQILVELAGIKKDLEWIKNNVK